MKFETYWRRFTKKNPRVVEERHVIVKSENFRRSMAEAYANGYRDGQAAAAHDKSMFQRIFG